MSSESAGLSSTGPVADFINSYNTILNEALGQAQSSPFNLSSTDLTYNLFSLAYYYGNISTHSLLDVGAFNQTEKL